MGGKTLEGDRLPASSAIPVGAGAQAVGCLPDLGQPAADVSQQARGTGPLEAHRRAFGIVLVVEVRMGRGLDDGSMLGDELLLGGRQAFALGGDRRPQGRGVAAVSFPLETPRRHVTRSHRAGCALVMRLGMLVV